MIKKLFICGLLSLLFVSASAQTPPPNDSIKVSFVAYWNKGDVYKFRVTKIQKRWKGLKLTRNQNNSYIARFEVIDSTSKSYKIKWRYKNQLANNLAIPKKLQERFEKYKFKEVIYTTDELGAFQGIENWKELGTAMQEFVKETTKHLLPSLEPAAQTKFRQAMLQLLTMYKSKEALEQLVFKEIAYIHSPFGAEYNTADSVQYEDQLPNLIGGSPIKADASVHFAKVDTTEGRCTMIQQLKLNPDDSKRMIKDFFRKMGLMNEEAKTALKQALIDITDYNQMDYYYYPGVPVEITTRRDAVFYLMGQKSRRRDIVKIELITD